MCDSRDDTSKRSTGASEWLRLSREKETYRCSTTPVLVTSTPRAAHSEDSSPSQKGSTPQRSRSWLRPQ